MSAPRRRTSPTLAAWSLLAWTLFLVAGVTALHSVGGALSPPPVTGTGTWGRWLGERRPAEAAFAVVRLVTLGLAWYLLAATVLATLVRLVGSHSMVRVADAFTVAMVRRVVGRAVGASLTAVALSGAGAGAPVWAEPGSGPGAVPGVESVAPGVVPTMRRLPDAPPSGAPATTPSTAVVASARLWTVQPGEHFWAVAEMVLAEAWSRPPVDDEVDPYWRTLVEANRSLLRDPANPDLLFPAQVITVPPPPPPG